MSADIPGFHVIDHSSGDPVMDVALEEALFRDFDHAKAGPLLRLWTPSALCVVAGVGRKVF
ncbi:MAG: hypothetical protein Kow00107_11120 [Planctomycetota bacterium]